MLIDDLRLRRRLNLPFSSVIHPVRPFSLVPLVTDTVAPMRGCWSSPPTTTPPITNDWALSTCFSYDEIMMARWPP